MLFEQTLAKWTAFASGLPVRPKALRAFGKYNSIKKLRNLLLLTLEFRQRRIAPSAFPIICQVDPTNICNLRCPLCPTGTGDYGRPKGMMNLQKFKEIIDEIGSYLYEINLYNFGEPLLNKEVFQMARYAHDHNILTCINTNLTVLTDEGAEALVRSGLDHVILSIDGLTPETYSKYRVGGDFDRVISNLKRVVDWKERLRSSSPFIEWQFLVFKHNEHEASRVEQFARSLGANGVIIQNAGMSTDNRVVNEAKEWLLEGKERGKYYTYSLGGGRACDWLWYTIVINHDGGVSPCCLAYKKEGDFGNFLTDSSSLREIWNNAKFQAARRIFREAKLSSDQDILCNSCWIAKDFIQACKKT